MNGDETKSHVVYIHPLKQIKNHQQKQIQTMEKNMEKKQPLEDVSPTLSILMPSNWRHFEDPKKHPCKKPGSFTFPLLRVQSLILIKQFWWIKPAVSVPGNSAGDLSWDGEFT